MPSQAAAESRSSYFSCAVTRKEAKRVAPSLPPPVKDAIYWLSNLDMTPVVINTVFFYPFNKKNNTADPAMVLQNALAQVLVHYYPLAGRIELSSEGRFQVISSGEGAVFVEAEADANISDVLAEKNLDTNMEFGHELLYNGRVGKSKSILDQPLLAIQVTKFKCGGFCVATSMNHSIFDGVALTEFLISFGEIARGVPMSMPPALDRTLLKARDPLQIEFPCSEIAKIDERNHVPTADDITRDPRKIEATVSEITKNYSITWSRAQDPRSNDTVCSVMCFDSKTIDVLKKQVLGEGILNTCTSFDVIGAFIWRIQTKALCMASSQLTKFEFPVDGRSRFCPPLPKGYHGNAVVLTQAIASAGELIDRELSYAVGLVQEAKAMVNDKYLRSIIDYLEQTRSWQFVTSTLFLSSLCKIPFHKADYGWGECTRCLPVRKPLLGVGLLLPCGKDRKGIKCLIGLPSFAWDNIKSILQQQRNLELCVELGAAATK